MSVLNYDVLRAIEIERLRRAKEVAPRAPGCALTAPGTARTLPSPRAQAAPLTTDWPGRPGRGGRPGHRHAVTWPGPARH